MASKGSSEAEIRIIKTLTAKEIEELTEIVNTAYTIGEKGFWVPQWRRTTVSELATLINEGKLVGCFLNNRPVGCVRTFLVTDKEAEFGMLAMDTAHLGTGFGKDLVQFVEDMWRARGVEKLQLDVVVPRTWVSDSKEFLKGWYGRRGYINQRTRKLEELEGTQSFLAQLVTEVDVLSYTKVL